MIAKINTNKNTSHLYEDIDGKLLYGFFIFFLLRASLTTEEFYSAVDLEKKYTNLLTEALLQDDLSATQPIEVIVHTYGEGIKNDFTSNPEHLTWQSAKINVYNFLLLGGIELLYKVDSRPWGYSFALTNTPTNTLIMPLVSPNPELAPLINKY